MSNNKKRDEERLALMCRHVARHFQGDVAAEVFDWFDSINRTFFRNQLPQPFILTGITPYGGCIGLTKRYDRPIILLHPSLVDPKARFYTLLHESIHVQVRYVLGYTGAKSHDSEEWLSEVNRIAPLLGYQDIVLGASKVTRQKKDEGGGLVRLSTGTVSYKCTSSFPHALEQETGQPLPPIEHWLRSLPSSNVTANSM